MKSANSKRCRLELSLLLLLSLLLSWLSLLLFIVYCNYLVIVIIIFTIIQLSVPTASGAALNHCHNCHAYGLVVTIVMIFNGDTRRVQTERSQRREGSPRTWWYRHHHHNLSSCIMYDNVYNIASSSSPSRVYPRRIRQQRPQRILQRRKHRKSTSQCRSQDNNAGGSQS